MVFHNDPNEKDETDDEEEYEDAADGYSKDNEMLILEKSGGEERYRMASVKKKNGSPLRHFDNRKFFFEKSFSRFRLKNKNFKNPENIEKFGVLYLRL